MTSTCRIWYRHFRSKWLSPGSFLLCAVTLAGVFAALHLAGWRVKTSVFSGTLPAGPRAQIVDGFEAVTYTFFYMAAVIVSPILTLAAGIFQGLSTWSNRRISGSPIHGKG